MDENEVMEDEEMILPDDFSEDTPIDEEEFDKEFLENEDENTEEQTSNSGNDSQEPEDEDKKFLEYLNKKGIKYNGENVVLENIDDVISNIQKGMNYDKVKSKNESESNAVMSYISEKASKMGITPEQYVERVKAYEKQKEQEAIEASVQNMMSNGVDEETARRVARTEAALDELEKEKAELKRQKEEREKQVREDQEYEDFLNEYPDIDVSKIPDEVYKDAKTMGLTGAYRKYENKILKEKLKTLEQNKKNASSSIVTATSNGGSTEQESKDAFLIGFDSE